MNVSQTNKSYLWFRKFGVTDLRDFHGSGDFDNFLSEFNQSGDRGKLLGYAIKRGDLILVFEQGIYTFEIYDDGEVLCTCATMFMPAP